MTASLQIATFAGAFPGADLSIPDGPPTNVTNIAAGSGGNVFGGSLAPAICELTPIGGNVTVTWPNGKAEVITSPCTRALRGEAITVA